MLCLGWRHGVTLSISLSAAAEAKLREQAAAAGQPLDVYASRLLEEATQEKSPGPGADPTVALLRSWNSEDATSDPAELEARQREWEEFAASINAHHSSSRKVYP